MIWLIIVSLIWGFSFGLIGNTLAGLPAEYISGVRLVLCFLVFLPFLRKVRWGVGLGLMGIGAIQFGMMYLAYITAFGYMKSYEIALFTVLTPIYVTLFNDMLRAKFSWQHLTLALLAVIGAGMILWHDGALASLQHIWRGSSINGAGSQMWKGFLILQFSNVCFAVGQILYARWQTAQMGVKEQSLFGWLYLGALVLVVCYISPTTWQTGWHATTSQQWLALLYLGIIASGLSFFLWNHGARLVSAGRLAIMNNLKIPCAAVCSIFIFQEQASLMTLSIGTLIVIISIILAAPWKTN